ncbi:hypothetical protein FRC06_006082 [Ceratobasidium sp. 370]|nr:hypothetical protein FRC06_006082 [Ceratobasidium sp. 370]
MPTLPLARALLPLMELFEGGEESMFECAPWTDPVFRHNLGLAPLSSEQDDEEDFDYDSPTTATSSAANGFVLSPAAIKSLSPAKQEELSDTTLLRAGSFMDNYLRKRALKAILEKWGVDWVMARLDLRRPTAAPPEKGEDNFWAAYRTVVLALFNRTGGIISIVADVMARHRATPVEALRDRREAARRRPDPSIDECELPTPPAAQYLESTELRNEVARLVFGDCAVNSRGLVNPEFRRTVSCLLSRVWESQSRKLEALKKRSKLRREEVDTLLEEAKWLRTPQSLKQVGMKLKQWRATAQQTLEHEEATFESREAALKELWEETGCLEEVVTKSKRKRMRKAGKSKSGSVMPDEAEMAAAFEHYMEDYCNSLCSDPSSLVPPTPESGPIDLTPHESDIGVDRFRDWSTEKAWANLGLPGATQFPFAEPSSQKPGEPAKAKAVPKWHQIIGVNAILEGAFTKELGDQARPTLLCDDVGLGKTLQIIGAISTIAHLHEQQKRPEQERLPPPAFTMENQTAYFAGLKEVPNRPTLITVPRTLARQWLEQLDTFTERGSFTILHFSNENKPLDTYFSDPNGEFKRATGPNGENASKVIVVAELSALAAEATRCLIPPPSNLRGRAAKLQRAEGRVPKLRAGVDARKSIFGVKWNLVAMDELHSFRNFSLAYLATLVLAENAHVRIGATATPIFTGPMDLASQGRVLRYEPMIGKSGRDICQRLINCQQQRAKEWETNDKNIIEAIIKAEVEQTASESGWSQDGPEVENATKVLRQKYGSNDQWEQLRRVFVARGAIEELRQVMIGIVVRRTGKSKDSSGNTVLELPPFKTLVAWSPLSPKELEEVARVNDEHLRAKNVRENPDEYEGAIIKWSNFLFDQKNAGMDCRIRQLRQEEIDQGLKKDSLTDKMADDWNANNIQEQASTRVQKVGELIEHYWHGNPKPPVYQADGTRDLAAEEQSEAPIPSERPRKFLIYVAYRLHRILIKKFLEVKGRAVVEYDGTMSTRKREVAVRRFTEDNNCRIMLISNVGAAGLNLTVASVVIFVSGVWSGLERMQIIGRLWRFGQMRDVIVIDIVAPGSIDLALAGYANGKIMMSDVFLAAGRELHRAHAIITSPAVDSEDEEEAEAAFDVESVTPSEDKQSKVVRRPRKRPVVVSEDEDNTEETSQGPAKCHKPAQVKERKGKALSKSQLTSRGAGESTISPSQPTVLDRSSMRTTATQGERETNECVSVATQSPEQQEPRRPRPRPKLRAISTPQVGDPAADSDHEMFDLSRTGVAPPPETFPPADRRRIDSSPSMDHNLPARAAPATASTQPTAPRAATTDRGPAAHAGPTGRAAFSEEERQLARDLGFGSPNAGPARNTTTRGSGTATGKVHAARAPKHVPAPRPAAPKVAKDAPRPSEPPSNVQQKNAPAESSSQPLRQPSSQPNQPIKRRAGFVPPGPSTAAAHRADNSRNRAVAMKLDQQEANVQALARPQNPARKPAFRLSTSHKSN